MNIGEKIRHLTLLEFSPNIRGYKRGVFRCDCGKIVIKNLYEIKRNNGASCGCDRVNDYNYRKHEKQTYNKLTIVKYLGKINKYHRYNYQCECGNIGVIIYDNLNKQISCGCVEHQFPYKPGDIVKNYKLLKRISINNLEAQCLICNTIRILHNAAFVNKRTNNCTCRTAYNLDDKEGILRLFSKNKRASDRRGREFKLTFDEYKTLILSNCYYCNKPPSIHKSEGKQEFRNGIDRIDSTKGYTIDNSRPCCYTCNVMKSNLTEFDFKNHITLLYNTFCKKDAK